MNPAIPKPSIRNLFKLLIIVFLGISINYIVYITGGTNTVWPQLNFITIVLAAYYWGERGSLITAFILALILGPFMPLNRFIGAMQTPQNWLLRMAFYLTVAYCVGFVVKKNISFQKIIKENYSRSHFNGLYNTNKLIPDLEDIMEKEQPFHLVFFNITNLEEISKYIDYHVMQSITRFCIDNLQLIFSEIPIYSINSNEFIIAIEEENEINFIDKVNSFLDIFSQSIKIDKYLFKLIIKIGIVRFENDKIGAPELFNKARIAADQGKDNTSGIYRYDKKFELKRKLYNEISASLGEAVTNNELFLVYQPVIDISEESVASCEILCRWDRGNRQPVGPNIFIQIAEETGTIKLISKWIVNTTMNHYIDLKEKGIDIKQSINLTATELLDDSFLEWGKTVIANSNICCKNFGIEITERVLSKDNDKLNSILSKLRDKGYVIEIDDFGTGYNSLMSIGEIPHDILKIDKYFIDKIKEVKIRKIIEHTINAAHEMGVQVIAEGVETKEQFLMLKNLNCDKIQGYYFSKPLKPDDFYDYCKNFDFKNYL